MSPLGFEVVGARAEAHAAVPTLALRLRITPASAEPVHAVALRCQIMIEPHRRRYAPREREPLSDLFGQPERWSTTLRPFLWSNVGTMVTGFTGPTEIDLPVTCTYDMEVASTRFFAALTDGEIPLLLLFSGTVFAVDPLVGGAATSVSPIAWHEEARFRLPVSMWRTVIDMYFPNSGWLRLQDETLDALRRFRSDRALLTWDDTLLALLKEAGESP